MSSPQAQSFIPHPREGVCVLRPEGRWFVTRGIALGVAAFFLWTALGARGLGLLLTAAAGAMWFLFRHSSIRLDAEGFTYDMVLRRVGQRWVDVDRFYVVEQRAYGFIRVSRYLGWNYSPAYKNYRRLAIPRTVARWVGMTDAMVKPIGFSVPELTNLLNACLERARSAADHALTRP